MSEILAKVAKFKGILKDDNKKDDDNQLHPQEEYALKKLQKEAKENGSTLATGGKGGLPPSHVLGAMRRDDFKCKRCGTKDNISVHHIGGIVSSKHVSEMGHKDKQNNLVTICEKCHDDIHQEAKKEGIDSSQVKPDGDKEN
jgi:hypothetical protein